MKSLTLKFVAQSQVILADNHLIDKQKREGSPNREFGDPAKPMGDFGIPICSETEIETGSPLSSVTVPLSDDDAKPADGDTDDTGPKYSVELSDALIMARLGHQNTDGVCKTEDGEKAQYIFSEEKLKEFKSAIDPKTMGLLLPETMDPDVRANIIGLIDNPPPLLDIPYPDPNKYVWTTTPLPERDVAVIRSVLYDFGLGEDSLLRRIPDDTNFQPDQYRYAFSLSITSEDYERVLFLIDKLSEGKHTLLANQIRGPLLTDIVSELQAKRRRKDDPREPLVISNALLAGSDNVADAKKEIGFLEGDPPPENDGVSYNDYVLLRVGLFPSDVAYFRWALFDNNNELFVKSTTLDDGSSLYLVNPYFSWHDDYSRILPETSFGLWTDVAAGLHLLCESKHIDDSECRETKEIFYESRRLGEAIKSDSWSYHTKFFGASAGLAFIALGISGERATSAIQLTVMSTVAAIRATSNNNDDNDDDPQGGGGSSVEAPAPSPEAAPEPAPTTVRTLPVTIPHPHQTQPGWGESAWTYLEENPNVAALGLGATGLCWAYWSGGLTALLGIDDATGLGSLDNGLALGTTALFLFSVGSFTHSAKYLTGTTDTTPTEWLEHHRGMVL